MRSFLVVAVALALASPAAAQQGAPAAAPSVAAIARLERERDKSPGALPAVRALGIAYYRSDRLADARRLLEQARALAPKDGVTALYLGMTAEKQGDLAAARAAYTSYLAVGRTSRTRGQLRARLAALTREELRQSARAAVAAEQSAGTTAGAPTTVAVLPLRFTGTDSTLAPLERGLADLLVTDLSRSAQLTVLERDRMQALLDEMTLAQSGVADSATAIRTGRLLSAGRVVQGAITQLGDRRIAVTAAVVDVPTTQAVGAAQGDESLDALFALEKSIALGVFDALGVRLTPKERAAVVERPTQSLAAFLAYSEGLAAEDRGDLDAARRAYERAAGADPSFRAAQSRQQRVEQARAAQGVNVATVEASLAGSSEGAIANAAANGVALGEPRSLGGTISSVVNDLNPSVATLVAGGVTTPSRDPASSATGTDNPLSALGRISIIIRQPQ